MLDIDEAVSDHCSDIINCGGTEKSGGHEGGRYDNRAEPHQLD